MDSKETLKKEKINIGLIIGAVFGIAGAGLMAIATPFVLPALRKHCLPYVPATETQLKNLSDAFKRHSKRGEKFLDIGSGDGRICRLAAQTSLYSEIHGVELNSVLVNYSRIISFKTAPKIRYYHRDLWNYPTHQYDSICVFGVESMMKPLKDHLLSSNTDFPQKIFACRFPFEGLKQIDEFGEGIDIVWVYKIEHERTERNIF